MPLFPLKALSPESAALTMASSGIALFSLMDVVMKGVSLELGAYNAMFWRSAIGVIIAGLLFARSRPAWPGNVAIRLHVLRGLVLALMTFLFFWGLKYLPIAEAVSLTFIAPLIALYLARVLLHEAIGRSAVLASLTGLFGAAIIVAGRFSGQYDAEAGKGIAAILGSAVLYAFNLILQRQQALVARPVEIAFFQNCVLLLVFGSLAPFFAVLPAAGIVPALAAAAILSIVSLQMMAWSYARATASILLPIEYTAFVWAALFGWLVFDDRLTVTTLAGTLLIVIGCLTTARQQPLVPQDAADQTRS
ncbi:MAG: DMT family transporter [Pseudomonadales bacterium]|nr:DMT family transporter [Pseudomonadales bacterium]